MKIPIIGKENDDKFEILPLAPEVHAETSPAEIDAKRAAHTLDRAAQLAERGDLNGAIVAARQAIALDHDSVVAYESLGNYLERNGDLAGAQTAFKHALQRGPQSALNRASLERIEEKISAKNHSGEFSFDDAELTDFSRAASVETEATPFDTQLNAPSEPVPTIDAKLPPTRAQIEATPTGAAPTENAPTPTASTVSNLAGNPQNDDKKAEDVAAIDFSSFFAAIPSPLPSDAVPSFGGEDKPLAIDAKLPPTTAVVASSSAPLPASLERRASTDRRQVDVPVDLERRVGQDRRGVATTAASLSPFVFQPVFDKPKTPLWAQFLRQPSFYGRTLPLVLLTVFSLGFLTWARARAISNSAQTPTVVAANPGGMPTDPISGALETQNLNQNPNSGTAPAPPLSASNPNNATDGFTITNNRVVASVPAPNVNASSSNAAPTNPSASAPANTGAPGRSANAGNRPTNSSANRPTSGSNRPRVASRPPQFPSASLRPAPIPPSAILEARDAANNRDNQREAGGGELGLPQPQISQGVPAEPPVRVLPSGSPLNAGGSPNRGYVRVQSGQLGAASAPRRPQAQANSAEEAANNAARGGQTDQAIQNLTSSINSNAGDSGFRLQQRASLFLERGDHARAVEDFQAAISAYQDQIERGENVSAARSGLRSARSGLNVAIAARRNGGN